MVTGGAVSVGTKVNIIPDRAQLLLNLRTYDLQPRERIIDSINRIVQGECGAAGSPKDPEFEFYDQFPLTTNDAEATAGITEEFVAHIAEEQVCQISPVTVSENFSTMPDAFGIPYIYWTAGCADPQKYRDAVSRGSVASDISATHPVLRLGR